MSPKPDSPPEPRRNELSRLAIGLLALGLLAYLGVGACLVWTWSQEAARHLTPPADVELDSDDILRRQVEKDRLATGAQILFGLAVLAGLLLTWLRIRVTDKQANAALRNAEIAQDQMKLARRQQTAERFTKAIEQLGSDEISIRLGGIYALEKIAQDEPVAYFNQFREVLCAFVREATREPHVVDEDGEPTPLPVDLQCSLTVLGRYSPPDVVNNPARIDWSGAHLEGTTLYQAHLKGADLSGAHLTNASLYQVHLEGAKLFRTHYNHQTSFPEGFTPPEEMIYMGPPSEVDPALAGPSEDPS